MYTLGRRVSRAAAPTLVHYWLLQLQLVDFVVAKYVVLIEAQMASFIAEIEKDLNAQRQGKKLDVAW